MPAKNVVKIYSANTVYHVYNRGVEKRKIFLNNQDCNMFLFILKYLLSPESPSAEQGLTLSKRLNDRLKTESGKAGSILIRPERHNFSRKIKLLCFQLMPNHFHLILRQLAPKDMSLFIHLLSSWYATYFNQKYNRVGGLFQGTYRAIQLNLPRDILYLSYYIHKNPYEDLGESGDYWSKNFSSLPYYLGKKTASWINPKPVLSQLRKLLPPYSSYRQFMDKEHPEFAQILKKRLLE